MSTKVRKELVTMSPAELREIQIDRKTEDNPGGYQRDPRHVHQIVRAFRKRYTEPGFKHAFMTDAPTVSRREDGTLWCIDGQGRIGACIELELSIDVVVVEGLTYDEEVKSFTDNNTKRTVSPNLYIDNIAQTSKDVGEFYELLTEIVPLWNQGSTPAISRLAYMDLVHIVRGHHPKCSKHSVQHLVETANPAVFHYIREVLSVLKQACEPLDDYFVGNKNERPVAPWTHREVLHGAVAVVLQFHKRFGNTSATNKRVLELFAKTFGQRKETIWEYSLRQADRCSTKSSRLAHYIANWIIHVQNRGKTNDKFVPYLYGIMHDEWKRVGTIELPFEHGYMTPEGGIPKLVAQRTQEKLSGLSKEAQANLDTTRKRRQVAYRR